MTKTALLLVDIQNDFFPKGALSVHHADEILPAINQLLSFPFDVIVATKDFHPVNHGSFAEHHHKTPGEKVILGGVEQILWPTHCVQGTYGAEFAPGWHTEKIDKVFFKGTERTIDSYSAFFDNGHCKSTGLADYLNEHGITDIYVAGLATDYCVKYSVLDALKLGFNVHVIKEGCRGVNLNSNDTDIAISEMKVAGAKIESVKFLK